MRQDQTNLKRIAAIITSLGLVLTACSSDSEAGNPTTTSPEAESTTVEVVQSREEVLFGKYVAALNAGDITEAMSFYLGDPVVKRHPFAANDYMDRRSEVRIAEELVPGIQGSGLGFELVDVAVAEGGSVAAPDITFGWRFTYGADGTESGGEAGCRGAKDAKAYISNGLITEVNWGFDDPTKCES